MIILLSFLFHFLYEFFPNFIFSILFPVNESIWEHMKLLYSGFIIWGIFEYYLIKKNNIKVNNYIKNLFFMSITSVIIYLIIYIPLYNIFKDNMIINISLLIIVILLEEIINYYMLLRDEKKSLNTVFITLIVLGYVVFTTLTYFPIKNYIFYDNNSNKYGVNIKD